MGWPANVNSRGDRPRGAVAVADPAAAGDHPRTRGFAGHVGALRDRRVDRRPDRQEGALLATGRIERLPGAEPAVAGPLAATAGHSGRNRAGLPGRIPACPKWPVAVLDRAGSPA